MSESFSPRNFFQTIKRGVCSFILSSLGGWEVSTGPHNKQQRKWQNSILKKERRAVCTQSIQQQSRVAESLPLAVKRSPT